MYFIDKNVIFDFARLVYFNESPAYYKNQALIVVLVNQGKIEAAVSDATFFSAGNYLAYKLERSGIENTDERTRNALKTIFKGNWRQISLSKQEFIECLEDCRLHYEDAYQLACAKKAGNNIVTRNLKDFEKIKEINVLAPKQLLQKIKDSELNEAEKELESILD